MQTVDCGGDCGGQKGWNLTGPTEGDGGGAEAGGDGRRRLDVEDDEVACGGGGVGGRGSELEVVEGPAQGVHALLAAINGHDHASELPSHEWFFNSNLTGDGSKRRCLPSTDSDTTSSPTKIFS